MGPICEALPWGMSFAHSKSHICAVQASEAQRAFETIRQATPQCCPDRLVKACASSLMGLFCAARPSSARFNPRAMQRGTRYCGLSLRTPEHLGLYTGIQFFILTFKTILKQKESHKTPLTLPLPAGSTCTSFSIFTFSHSTQILS